MQRKGVVAAAAFLAALVPAAAMAATGSNPGPQSSWDNMQKFEYHVGQTAGALNICGHFDYARRLKELADLSPYGRKGWAGIQVYDSIRGGYCGQIAADAEEILADRDRLFDYLTAKYDCPQGYCMPEEASGSETAPCRGEAEEHLSSLQVAGSDIKDLRMVRRNAEATRLTTGKAGHEAWVRLNSCSGWLIIELSKGCYPQQSFTRGECKIDGISGF